MDGFMDWVRILAYITGTVDQELLLRKSTLLLKTESSKLSSRPRCDLLTRSGLHIDGSACCKERLVGLLRYYHREAA
jgi:hypothetical protein